MARKHILIVSDTHSMPQRLKSCMQLEGPFDMALHMGDMDGCQDIIEEILQCPIQAVRGNCDFRSEWPRETLVEVGGHLIFMTHGHNYDVKYDMNRLESVARDYGADIAMFGHTHVPYYKIMEDGLVILNPGSLGYPRQRPRKPSYMIMDVEEETGEVSFYQCFLHDA